MRNYRNALPHQHWAVVHWVRDNLSEQTWVGAVQTGTLGYFHVRTLNLDGKVNVQALRAREAGTSAFYRYVVEEQRVEYMVDWHGLRDWYDNHAILRDHFEMIVIDRESNLMVMRRRNFNSASGE